MTRFGELGDLEIVANGPYILHVIDRRDGKLLFRMVRASDEMTPAEKQTTDLMSLSPLLSTQICSLVEIVSALEKADAKAAMSPDALMDDEDYQDDR